jgi:hypothetical protein
MYEKFKFCLHFVILLYKVSQDFAVHIQLMPKMAIISISVALIYVKNYAHRWSFTVSFDISYGLYWKV